MFAQNLTCDWFGAYNVVNIITQQFNETINLINKYVYVIYFLNKKSNSCKFVYKTSVYLIQLRFVSVITAITIHAM